MVAPADLMPKTFGYDTENLKYGGGHMKYGTENLRSGTDNVRYAAGNLRYGAENLLHVAKSLVLSRLEEKTKLVTFWDPFVFAVLNS